MSAELAPPLPKATGQPRWWRNDPFAAASETGQGELRARTIRGGAVTVTSQLTKFVLQTLSTMLMARLVAPNHFGLIGMVTALTGLLTVIRDAGLSTATIQRDVITREQISTLFWINTGLGFALAIVSALLAPVVAGFYGEPRLVMITMLLAITSIFSGLAAQHQALLRRQMRFSALAAIDLGSLLAGTVVGVVMGMKNYGYWALIGMQIAQAFVVWIGTFVALPWIPGAPIRGAGIGSMLRFGSFLTGSNLMNYLFRNTDNVLIGWYWGAGPLGLYSKAYGLLMLPLNQVNWPVGNVAVPALSRVLQEPERFRRYFLGGYTIVASLTLPVIAASTIFAEEIIRIMLGSQWGGAVNLFRLLAPAAISGALLNPFGWLFVATGRADRQFRFAILWSGLIVLAFAAGLRFGPEGVAMGYSIMSCALGIPLARYATHGTAIRLRHLMMALIAPLVSTIVAAGAGVALKLAFGGHGTAMSRGIVGCAGVLLIYAFVLLVVMRRWAFYRELLRELMPGRFSRR